MKQIDNYILEKLHIDKNYKSANDKLDDKRVPVPFDTIYEWFYNLIDEYFKIIKNRIQKCKIDDITSSNTYDRFSLFIYTSSINTLNDNNLHTIGSLLREKLHKETDKNVEYSIFNGSIKMYITFYIYK